MLQPLHHTTPLEVRHVLLKDSLHFLQVARIQPVCRDSQPSSLTRLPDCCWPGPGPRLGAVRDRRETRRETRRKHTGDGATEPGCTARPGCCPALLPPLFGNHSGPRGSFRSPYPKEGGELTLVFVPPNLLDILETRR